MRDTSAGITLDSTLISPEAPTAISGMVWSSLPLYTYSSSPQQASSSVMKLRFPLASLVATMFGCLASSRYVSSEMPIPVREGTLYKITGLSQASAIFSKWRTRPRCEVLL